MLNRRWWGHVNDVVKQYLRTWSKYYEISNSNRSRHDRHCVQFLSFHLFLYCIRSHLSIMTGGHYSHCVCGQIFFFFFIKNLYQDDASCTSAQGSWGCGLRDSSLRPDPKNDALLTSILANDANWAILSAAAKYRIQSTWSVRGKCAYLCAITLPRTFHFQSSVLQEYQWKNWSSPSPSSSVKYLLDFTPF